MTIRSAIALYALLFVLTTSVFIINGEVIAPYRQYQDIGLKDSSGSTRLENRKFGDFVKVYIPEISLNLDAPRSGWLTLWTTQNEFGRPLTHLFGFSAAYFPSWIIGTFTDNPWRFITILSLGFCFLTGIFMIMLCKELNLSPFSGFVSGALLALSPFFMYWLTFPMFLAVRCWTVGILWGLARTSNKMDFLGWCILSFCFYSLFMTGYPQSVIYHLYIIAGFGFFLLFLKFRSGKAEAPRFFFYCFSALIVAVIVVLPILVDLLGVASESARKNSDISFFTSALPNLNSWLDIWRFLVLSWVPELFGNPVNPDYPLLYDGQSIPVLTMCLVIISAFTSLRKTWGWWLLVLTLIGFTFSPTMFVFGVDYLGFNLSRGSPFSKIILPLTIMAAYGVDALMKKSLVRNLDKFIIVAMLSGVSIIFLGVGYGIHQAIEIQWQEVVLMIAVVATVAVQYKTYSKVLLSIGLVLSVMLTSFPLILSQDLRRIAVTSPLVEKVRANLPEDSRFAFVPPFLNVLPANMNASFGIASVHSYNSLSPERYHHLIRAMGGRMFVYGRYNRAIQPNPNGHMFWMSNIGVLLSSRMLSHPNVEYMGKVAGTHIHKTKSRMGKAIQVMRTIGDDGSGLLKIGDPRSYDYVVPDKIIDKGDMLEYEVESGKSSLLILSQKFHGSWQAKVLSESVWRDVDTVEVNGVFQGVLLPKLSQRVRLEFLPYSRYAWIGHVFWFGLLLVLLYRKKRVNKLLL